MRTLIISAALVAVAVVTAPVASEAGGKKKDWICWMQPSGTSDCAWLENDHYHIHVMRAHRHQRDCNHCAVPFTLDDDKIHHIGDEGISTKTMRPFHDAAVYGSKHRNSYKSHD